MKIRSKEIVLAQTFNLKSRLILCYLFSLQKKNRLQLEQAVKARLRRVKI